MRLIDSDEVKETARRIAKIPWGDDRGHKVEMRWTLEELERLIDTAPTIQAEPIVRCKNCKHKYISGNGTTQYYVCDFMDAQYEEDGFCHHAESEIEE